MTSYLICNPSWGVTEVEGNDRPEKLGLELAKLIGRDGIEEASDMLHDFPCWKSVDSSFKKDDGEVDADGEKSIDGYGIAYTGFDAGTDGDYDFAYGIMTDGTVLVTDYKKNVTAPIEPKAENPLGKYQSLVS